MTENLQKKLKNIESLAERGNIAAALFNAKNAELHANEHDEKFALYLYIHALELLHDHKYLFDDQKDKSEDNYVVKCWGPVLERLMAKTDVRCKWGDTMCSLTRKSLRSTCGLSRTLTAKNMTLHAPSLPKIMQLPKNSPKIMPKSSQNYDRSKADFGFDPLCVQF